MRIYYVLLKYVGFTFFSFFFQETGCCKGEQNVLVKELKSHESGNLMIEVSLCPPIIYIIDA